MATNDSIAPIILEILKSRFPNIPEKQKINPNNRGFKIACPYCGDSRTDPSKKRGNVYIKSNSYKCYNDGCLKFTSLGKFIADFSIQYGIDIMSIDLDFDSNWKKSSVKLKTGRDNPIVKYLKDNGDYDKLLDVNYFIKYYGLRTMSDLPQGITDVGNFITERRLDLSYSFQQLCYFDAMYDKVYFLNIHIPTGKVLGLSYRMIHTKNFKIYTYDTMKELWGIDIDFEDPDTVSTLGNYYNILNINFNEPVALTEAQIDSMFILNCMGIQGISKTQFLFDYIEDVEYNMLFDSDSAGLKEMLTDGLEGKGFIMWTKLKDDLRKINISDARKIKKIKDINDLFRYFYDIYKINTNDFQILINKYLTNDPMDTFFL